MMGSYWASANGGTHLCAPVNPKIQRIAERIGSKVIGEAFESAHGSRPGGMNDAFLDFIHKQDIAVWLESFEREFYAAGLA